MAEKYLQIDLNDEKSSAIAEILGNKTCKKILNLLAEREGALSVGDISKDLKIPMNTADYNVKKLLEAGFIEKTRGFFWSVKGKKIPTYTLANKKIIISTKKSFKSLLASILAGGIIFGAAKVLMNYQSINISRNLVTEKSSDLVYSSSQAAPAASETAGNAIQFMQTTSIFQNIWLWVLAGLVIGVLGYFILKKINQMKGGRN